MKMEVADTGIGLGQIFKSAALTFTSLGRVIADILEAAADDVVLCVRGLNAGETALAALEDASVIRITTIPDGDNFMPDGGGDADQEISSTLAARTTYDFVDGNTVTLGGGAISLRGLLDKMVADSHGGTVTGIQGIRIDQDEGLLMIADSGSTVKPAVANDATEDLVVKLSKTATGKWE